MGRTSLMAALILVAPHISSTLVVVEPPMIAQTNQPRKGRPRHFGPPPKRIVPGATIKRTARQFVRTKK